MRSGLGILLAEGNAVHVSQRQIGLSTLLGDMTAGIVLALFGRIDAETLDSFAKMFVQFDAYGLIVIVTLLLIGHQLPIVPIVALVLSKRPP